VSSKAECGGAQLWIVRSDPSASIVAPWPKRSQDATLQTNGHCMNSDLSFLLVVFIHNKQQRFLVTDFESDAVFFSSCLGELVGTCIAQTL
jgi:hypothetical protein